MNKILSTLIGSSVFIAGVTFAVTPAFALPGLQLDILGGTYNSNPSEESVVSTANSSTVFAYCDQATNGSGTNCDTNLNYYLSFGLISDNPITNTTNFGSFVFNGVTYNSSNLSFGTPSDTPGGVATHGSIFPTFFGEQQFRFDPTVLRSSINVQPNSGTTPNSPTGTDNGLAYRGFGYDISGLGAGFNLHFDLYNKERGSAAAFAPFSHDARTDKNNTTIPEPSAMLALGLLGGGMFLSRRRRHG